MAIVAPNNESTVINALRGSVDLSISKHARKILGNKLYKMWLNYPELSEMVIRALQKDFAYAMQQCKDGPTRLAFIFFILPIHLRTSPKYTKGQLFASCQASR